MVFDMSDKPSIIVIPGSASPAALYALMVQHLMSFGFEANVYDLPSASRAPPQEPAGLADDAAFFNRKIRSLADAGNNIVVVAHSYGGLVATDAAQGQSWEEREAKGLKGGIVRIVHLTCIVAPVGQGSSDVCSGLNFDFMEPVGEVRA